MESTVIASSNNSGVESPMFNAQPTDGLPAYSVSANGEECVVVRSVETHEKTLEEVSPNLRVHPSTDYMPGVQLNNQNDGSHKPAYEAVRRPPQSDGILHTVEYRLQNQGETNNIGNPPADVPEPTIGAAEGEKVPGEPMNALRPPSESPLPSLPPPQIPPRFTGEINPPLNQAAPPLNQAMPPLNHTPPPLNHGAPPLGQATPQIPPRFTGEPTPPLNQTVPPLNQAMPPLNHTPPSVNHAPPPLNQATRPQIPPRPTGEPTLPASQAKPPLDQAMPSLNQAIPPVNQAMPPQTPHLTSEPTPPPNQAPPALNQAPSPLNHAAPLPSHASSLPSHASFLPSHASFLPSHASFPSHATPPLNQTTSSLNQTVPPLNHSPPPLNHATAPSYPVIPSIIPPNVPVVAPALPARRPPQNAESVQIPVPQMPPNQPPTWASRPQPSSAWVPEIPAAPESTSLDQQYATPPPLPKAENINIQSASLSTALQASTKSISDSSYAGALKALRSALSTVDIPYERAMLFLWLGQICCEAREYHSASADIAIAHDLFTSLGDFSGRLECELILVRISRGRDPGSTLPDNKLKQLLIEAQKRQLKNAEVSFLCELCELACAAKNTADMTTHSERAKSVAHMSGDMWCKAETSRISGLVSEATGDFVTALQSYSCALELYRGAVPRSPLLPVKDLEDRIHRMRYRLSTSMSKQNRGRFTLF